MSRLPPAIFLLGPTAAGKTALALELHARLPVDIISVDSGQVYRGLDIGTAKPSADELARVPQRLIDIRDPAERYSAAEFRADALREMAAIVARGRVPLLVGGTMFYFHALEHGLSDLPSADAEVRAGIAAEAAQLGWPALHARLAAADPATAARVQPTDPQRIQRALEILEITGQSPSSLQGKAEPFPYRAFKLALIPEDRKRLHTDIELRFRDMLARGLIEEVQVLKGREDLHLGLPAMRTVGYRQVWQYLEGDLNYTDMVARGVATTRQLAKRQLTWLRRMNGLHRIESTDTNLITMGVSFAQQALE